MQHLWHCTKWRKPARKARRHSRRQFIQQLRDCLSWHWLFDWGIFAEMRLLDQGSITWCCQSVFSLEYDLIVTVNLCRVVAVKVAVHSLLHSLQIETREEPNARLGKMCASQVPGGSCGMFSCAVCVNCRELSHLEGGGLRCWG